MKIKRVDIYSFDLTYVHGTYVMSGGREITSLPSTLVRVTADTGFQGWGEVCPLGTTYLPAHAQGARAALQAVCRSDRGWISKSTCPNSVSLCSALADTFGIT